MSDDRQNSNRPFDPPVGTFAGWNSRVIASACESIERHAESDSDWNDDDETRDSGGSQKDVRLISETISQYWDSMLESTSTDGQPRGPTSATEEAMSATIPSLAGKRLGKYQVLEMAGTGGFGIVFRARDVALKIPRPEIVDNPRLRDRLHFEARLGALLRHPGIVQVYEARRIGPVSYIASEYCEGPNLHAWLQQNSLTDRQAVMLMADVADAAGYAHSRGVVHQDLKPANILIERAASGQASAVMPRISDFGFAFNVDERESGARHLWGGTRAYMAPEQVARQSTEIGTHTDVYALGMMLAELLSSGLPDQAPNRFLTIRKLSELTRRTRMVASRGRGSFSCRRLPVWRVWNGASRHEKDPRPRSDVGAPAGVADQLLSAESRSLAATPCGLRRNGSRDLQAIVDKCLQRDPEQRYRNGWELRDDLRRYLVGAPVAARPISPWEATIRWVRRRPSVAGLAAILVFVIATSIVGLSVMLSNEHHLRQTADRRLRESQEVVDTMIGRFIENSYWAEMTATTEQEKLLEYALEYYERLVAEFPEDDSIRHRLTDALHRLSEIQFFAQRYPVALETRKRGVEMLQELVARNPMNNQYRYDLFYNLYRLGAYHENFKNWDEAVKYHDRCKRELEKLLAVDPGNYTYQASMVAYHGSDAALAVHRGEQERLPAMLQEQENRIRELLRQYPDDFDLTMHLGICLQQRAEAAGTSHKWPETLDFAQQASELARRTIEMRPEWRMNHGRLASRLTLVAIAQKQLGNTVDAEPRFIEAIDLYTSLGDFGVDSTSKCRAQIELADLYYQDGRHDAARELFTDSGKKLWEVRSKYPNQDYQPEIDQWLAKCPFEDLLALYREGERTVE